MSKMTCEVCGREFTAARWDPPNICRSCAEAKMLAESRGWQTKCRTCGAGFLPSSATDHLCPMCWLQFSHGLLPQESRPAVGSGPTEQTDSPIAVQPPAAGPSEGESSPASRDNHCA